MWECAVCRKVLWKNSGIHRVVRSPSGHHRTASLCPGCASKMDGGEKPGWRMALTFAGMAIVVAAVVAVIILKPF